MNEYVGCMNYIIIVIIHAYKEGKHPSAHDWSYMIHSATMEFFRYFAVTLPWILSGTVATSDKHRLIVR